MSFSTIAVRAVAIDTLRKVLRSLLFLCLSVAAGAQRPSPGLKVGVPVAAVCASESSGRFGSANVCSDRYVIGPSMAVEIAGRLSLDFSAPSCTRFVTGQAANHNSIRDLRVIR